MGIKSKFVWRLKTRKIARPMMRSIYEVIVNQLIEEAETPAEFNKRLRDYGKIAGEKLLIDYSKRIAKHAQTFPEFVNTLAIAYKVNAGQDFTRAEVNDAGDEIYLGDANCLLCEGVELDSKEMRYCEFVAGIFEAGLALRGFKGTVREEKCKATGDDECLWVLRRTE